MSPYIYDERPWLESFERFGIPNDISMPPVHTSLLDMFEERFKRFGQQTAYICRDKRLSYQQLEQDSRHIASYLQQLGLQKGDKVAVMLPNILQYPVIAFAIIRAGMVLVNINPLYVSQELKHQLNDGDVKAIFLLDIFNKSYADIADQVAVEHVIVCQLSDYLSWYQTIFEKRIVGYQYKQSYVFIKHSVSYLNAKNIGMAHHYQRPKMSLTDVAMLQYTGGTTGVAKGAMLTHGNLIANLLQINAWFCAAYSELHLFDIKPEDEVVSTPLDAVLENTDAHNNLVLTVLPMYHVYSFMVGGLFNCMVGNTSVLIINPTNIDDIIQHIQRYQPNVISAVTTLFKHLLAHRKITKLDFSQLKLTIGGGMSVTAEVAKKWHQITGLPIIEGYGLSETSPVVMTNPMNIGSFNYKVGIPLPSTDIQILDERNNRIPIGERGEICVKGPQVMLGYYGKESLNKDSFTTQGYFKTGDIGIMDEKGFVRIVDRKKDMILVSGFNVYPSEIEQVMQQHPAVLLCAAIGVPSKESGEEPKLYVVTNQKVSEQELLEHGKQNLTRYKRPKRIKFVEQIPMSAVGKILRKELRKMEGLQ